MTKVEFENARVQIATHTWLKLGSISTAALTQSAGKHLKQRRLLTKKMGNCYFCYWGWPVPVKEIYDDAVARLDGNDEPLKFGPSHIVWSDENFDDDCIRWCLNEIANNRIVYELGDNEISIVKDSLERLLLVPAEMREPPDGYADNDDHPELYPPAFAVAQK